MRASRAPAQLRGVRSADRFRAGAVQPHSGRVGTSSTMEFKDRIVGFEGEWSNAQCPAKRLDSVCAAPITRTHSAISAGLPACECRPCTCQNPPSSPPFYQQFPELSPSVVTLPRRPHLSQTHNALFALPFRTGAPIMTRWGSRNPYSTCTRELCAACSQVHRLAPPDHHFPTIAVCHICARGCFQCGYHPFLAVMCVVRGQIR